MEKQKVAAITETLEVDDVINLQFTRYVVTFRLTLGGRSLNVVQWDDRCSEGRVCEFLAPKD